MAFPVVRVCITVVGLVQSSFLCAGSAVIVVIYACVVTCGRSFTMLSGWGISISFWSVLAVLSIRAGSRPKQPATGQSLAGYFRLTLLFILVRNLK